jgi:putative hydrolase of the HAD superfamily
MDAAQQPVSAVLFDFGGVITDDPFRSMAGAAAGFGMDLAEFGAIAIGMGDYGAGDHPWHRLERGEIELDDYNRAADALARSRGHQGFPPLPIELIATRTFVVRPAMVELIRHLRSVGIATAIVTNNVRALGSWRQALDWDELVDIVVDSCQVGMRKPEPRIYHHVCDVLAVSPAESVFLDDMASNVEAAVGVGMRGILVTDPAEAIAEVRRLVE